MANTQHYYKIKKRKYLTRVVTINTKEHVRVLSVLYLTIFHTAELNLSPLVAAVFPAHLQSDTKTTRVSNTALTI